MFIEKDGLKELIEKRLEIKAELESINTEIVEHSEKIKALQGEKTQETQARFKEVNEKINALALMEVWNTLKETEMPGEFIIKDDKPFCTVIDITAEVIEQAKSSKEDWTKFLSELAKDTK